MSGEYICMEGIHGCEIIEEHGREWAVCRKCGAIWSIDEHGNGEIVTEGDGWCESNEDYLDTPLGDWS